jgi:hypothetical protein
VTERERSGPKNRTPMVAFVAAIPVVALTVGVPFANRLEPRILGLPFIIGYLTVWVVLTPFFLYLADWVRRNK